MGRSEGAKVFTGCQIDSLAFEISVTPDATRNVTYTLNNHGAGLLLRKQGDPYNVSLQDFLEVK